MKQYEILHKLTLEIFGIKLCIEHSTTRDLKHLERNWIIDYTEIFVQANYIINYSITRKINDCTERHTRKVNWIKQKKPG